MAFRKLCFLFSALILGVGVLISYLDSSCPYLGFKELTKTDVDVAICVLSARENFDQRAAIRKSWMKEVTDVNSEYHKSVMAKFVVGSVACPVHKQDRVDAEGCEKWTPVLPTEEQRDGLSAFVLTDVLTSRGPVSPVTSVYFKVLHDVTVERIGLSGLLPLPDTSWGRVLEAVMYDAVSDEEVSRVSFRPEHPGKSHKGYNYRSVPALMLPKVGLLSMLA
ncbi:UDP-GalNAc:beta-1,3-N-acetylgalactosaminyltransferase 2 [Aplysia californica]|uniref:UDP-GalNAc:beta-1, 3-N-acetylgalactosaminyltransferase 2 n=1 Tax=Aplysia californica TaxID=6500 RepID=A0ABM1A807_APLCA|nr:UDP-GalNAc:beta-1,3-N-acetylgalactosaminyltransferase 2 [Aplysia californica]